MIDVEALRVCIARITAERFRFQDPRKPRHLHESGLPFARMDSPVYRICLAEIARSASPRRFLEIGVKRGESMALVLQASLAVAEVTLCDFWTINEKKKLEYKAVVDKVEAARGNGREINATFLDGSSLVTLKNVEGKFELVGIDGSHRRDVFRSDLANALRLVSDGGFIVVDDLVLHEDHKIDQELLQFVRANYGIVEIVYRNTTNWPGGAILRRVAHHSASIRALVASAIAVDMNYVDFARSLVVYGGDVHFREDVAYYIEQQDWQALDYLIYTMSVSPRSEHLPLLEQILARGTLEVDLDRVIATGKALGWSNEDLGSLSKGIAFVNGLNWSAQPA